MTETILKTVFDILNDNKINPETITLVTNQLSNTLNQNNNIQPTNNNIEFDVLQKKLQTLWEQDYEANSLLVKRALDWLEFSNINTTENNTTELDVVLKLLQLGKLVSEDINLEGTNTPNSTLTKQQAINQRNKLINNKDFMQAINNNANLNHNQALDQLNKLNSIIANY